MFPTEFTITTYQTKNRNENSQRMGAGDFGVGTISNMIKLLMVIHTGLLTLGFTKLNNQSENLILKITHHKNIAKSSDETYICFEFINNDIVNAKVPQRMLLGYEDDLDRDLYLEIKTKNNKIYNEFLNNRSDYQSLDIDEILKVITPGQNIKFEYNIQSLYPLPKKGVYKIRAVYDPIPSLKSGKLIYSEWIEINIK